MSPFGFTMGGLDPPTQGQQAAVFVALDGRLKAGHGEFQGKGKSPGLKPC